MRGINKIVISGNITAEIRYNQTRQGVDVCTFGIVSERSSGSGSHKVFAKINVYMSHLVARCHERLKAGGYVIIEGELMNRDGRSEALTEVRARDLVFV